MAESKFYSSLKIGLLTVSLAYFLFSLHALFTLSWIGEWNYIAGGSAMFWIFITDVSASFGLVFRFIASIIAIAAIVFYFFRKGLPETTAFKLLRWILIFEALYWVPLFLSGLMGFMPVDLSGLGGNALNLGLLITTGIPCLVSSTVVPVALFKLVSKLNLNKPPKDVIRWGLIAGTLYVFVFWLNNMGMWIATYFSKGAEYFSAYPENMLSFVLTVYGLPVLLAFTAYVTGKNIATGTNAFEKINFKPIGAIITVLGLYFLWNYLTWIFFGGDHLWSDWYAWFLGHNLDLWMLSLPLVGLPLLLKRLDS